MRSTQAVGESRWRSQFLQPGIALLHCGVLAPRSSRAPAIPGLALSKVSRRSRPRSPATAGGAVNFSSLELRFCTAVWLAPRSLRPVLLSSASKVSEVDPCRKRQRLVGRPLSQAREAGAVNFSSLGSRFCTAVLPVLPSSRAPAIPGLAHSKVSQRGRPQSLAQSIPPAWDRTFALRQCSRLPCSGRSSTQPSPNSAGLNSAEVSTQQVPSQQSLRNARQPDKLRQMQRTG